MNNNKRSRGNWWFHNTQDHLARVSREERIPRRKIFRFLSVQARRLKGLSALEQGRVLKGCDYTLRQALYEMARFGHVFEPENRA